MYTRHGLTKDDSELAEPLKGGSATAPRTLGRATLLVTAATVGMLAAFCAGALFASASGPARAGSGAELPVLGGGKPMKVAPAPVASGKRFRTNLAFQDEFDFLDFSKWRHEITMGGGGNWEFQYYTNNRSNTFVRNGTLHIHPTFTADKVGDELVEEGGELDLWGTTPASQCTSNAFWGCYRTSGLGGNMINPIQSGRLRTYESFNFKYGRVEIRAKLPRGDWIWPAMWLLPTNEEYGPWPASGEIDLVEGRGNPGVKGGSDTYGSTLHWGPSWQDNHWAESHDEYTLPEGAGDFADEFHVFGLYWDEQEIYTYVDTDDNVVMRMAFNESLWHKGSRVHGDFERAREDNPWQDSPNKNAPFDKDFFLIMNLAVGGTNKYFGEDMPDKPWTHGTKHAVDQFWKARHKWGPTWKGEDADMRVDYVRIWTD